MSVLFNWFRQNHFNYSAIDLKALLSIGEHVVIKLFLVVWQPLAT